MQRAKNIEEIIAGFNLIRQQLHSTVDGVSQWSLSHSQWLALTVIARGDSVTVTDLRTALSISSSAATQLANSLQKKGHIHRTAHVTDGRVSVLVLTSHTKEIFNTIRTKKLAEFGKLFSALSDAEFAQYFKLHTKLIKSIS